jgi:hypothetical protein
MIASVQVHEVAASPTLTMAEAEIDLNIIGNGTIAGLSHARSIFLELRREGLNHQMMLLNPLPLPGLVPNFVPLLETC